MTSEKLIRAAQQGNIRRLVAALKSGADPNAKEDQGRTPIHWAAQEGYTAIVERLIRSGADINVVDSDGFSPLMIAVGEGHIELVLKLILCGVNISQKSVPHKNGTPLHLACAWNHLGIVEALISAGADINAEDLEGRSPIFFAVMYGHRDVVKLLLEHGCIVDPNKKDLEEKKTIFDLAIELGDPIIHGLLSSRQTL